MVIPDSVCCGRFLLPNPRSFRAGNEAEQKTPLGVVPVAIGMCLANGASCSSGKDMDLFADLRHSRLRVSREGEGNETGAILWKADPVPFISPVI